MPSSWLTGGMRSDDVPERLEPSEQQPDSPFDAAFAAPEGMPWNRVSPALSWYRRMVLLAVLSPLAAAGAVMLGVWVGPVEAALWLVAAIGMAAAGWLLVALGQRALGYAEGRTDFYLTHGVVVRQLVVVPYGRMQLVDVTSNLLEQLLGIATVRVRTAAAPGEACVVGLSLEEATRLRDRLTAQSETFSTGL